MLRRGGNFVGNWQWIDYFHPHLVPGDKYLMYCSKLWESGNCHSPTHLNTTRVGANTLLVGKGPDSPTQICKQLQVILGGKCWGKLMGTYYLPLTCLCRQHTIISICLTAIATPARVVNTLELCTSWYEYKLCDPGHQFLLTRFLN